jgi:hypothetical protein
MKTVLEIVVALMTSILFSGAAIGAIILGGCVVGAGGCYGLWRWRNHRRRAHDGNQ